MRSSSLPRSAFTLIEMVVVLAILGIALSIAGPSLIRPVTANNLQSVIDRTRSLALRRAEPVMLVVAEDGEWRAYAVRSGRDPVASGKLGESSATGMRIDISALGLCTSDEISSDGTVGATTLNPFACTVTNVAGPSR